MVKWVVWVVGTAVVAGGVALVLAALFRDRSRGRRRCPACWYDLSGTPVAAESDGVQCPECGRTYTREKSLLRTRRRWRLGLVGVLMMMVGYAGFVVRKAVVDGWPTAIPSSVLVMMWPMPEGEWLDYDAGRGNIADDALWELRFNRLEEGRLARWQEVWWVDRLERFAKNNRRFGVDAERETLRRLRETVLPLPKGIRATDEFARMVFETCGVKVTIASESLNPPLRAPLEPMSVFHAIEKMCEQLDRTVENNSRSPGRWPLHGWCWAIDGNQILMEWGNVAAKPELHTVSVYRTEDVVRHIEQQWSSLRPRSESFDRRQIMQEFVDACALVIKPEAWRANGGSDASLTNIGNAVVVQADPYTTLMVENLIDRIRSPRDPLRANDESAEWVKMASNLAKLHNTVFKLNERTESVEELVRDLEAQSGVRIRQEWSFISPVILDAPARQRLAQRGVTCVDALDEAMRCVTESKVFIGCWCLTVEGARVFPDARGVPREIRVYDATNLLPRVQKGELAPSPSDAMLDLQRLLSSTIDIDNWIENGGELNLSSSVGTLLIISAPARTQIAVERMLDQIRAGNAK